MPTLTKTKGDPIYCSATFKNTGTKDIGQFSVGFAMGTRGGYRIDLGPLARGAEVTLPKTKVLETTDMAVGTYQMTMYFFDMAVSSTSFAQYLIADWSIVIQEPQYGVTPSNITLSFVELS
ncbi:MAG: hypothetical protein QW587_04755 [Candidatus Bathyarchaeia archaeon]